MTIFTSNELNKLESTDITNLIYSFSNSNEKNVIALQNTSTKQRKHVSDWLKRKDNLPLAQRVATVAVVLEAQAAVEAQRELPRVQSRNKKIRELRDLGVSAFVATYSYFTINTLLRSDDFKMDLMAQQVFFFVASRLAWRGSAYIETKLNEGESKLKRMADKAVDLPQS